MTQTYVSKVRTAVNDDQVVVFNLMVSCMSAERQFDLTKLGIDVDKLPSASRKLVQERIFPKEFLNNYSRLRDRANAVLDRGAAVRLEMGVVSSRTEAVAKIEDLDAIKADWAAQIEKDSHRYASICNERIALIAAEAYNEQVPADVVNTLVDALRKRQPTWEHFVSRMNFAYSPVPIKLELDETKAEFDPILFKAQREGLVALREGVFGALVQYLTRESNEILKVLNGKKQHHGVYTINYRTVARIGEITEKLHGLAFVHQQVAPLASVIDAALAFMPKSVEKDLGLQPSQFFNLIACLEAMGDQHELLARLRDKQPLVEVSNQLPPVMVANGHAVSNSIAQQALATARNSLGAAQQTPVVLSPAVSTAQVVEEAEMEASQEVEVEAEPAVQESFMGLGFMGATLFD
ncbi:DUF3150 domain-containing protein [Pseudomonas aeruginosa]|jgi:hypothetical protein|uniref:DUF3150 domain-containing protein n=1 Tax=Pseudomonas putida TaxID=303 RepID=A0A1L7NNK5_PSEPU|nr:MULTISPECIES: DUF3150 domain-containing protein [Pseudomonas]OWG36967.1 hypothetical protein CAQ69_18090 [Stutzerimonas stutzeri]MCR7872861.1 DUF3150 domain-containing protein [Pseudomonas aeruginosa]MCS7527191.1 DUF3150 domain-containing protein [Pseudomonas aeruginosa]MCS8510121.1 DUF3150 domain-containing protein [Pseudomonas aeruginosa]MCS8541371.1 DUF3150 domain-containing protein [Pseudomonas aeruginosa]